MSSIHPNYTKASNLILISLGIAFIGFIQIGEQLTTTMLVILIITSSIIFLGLAYLVRKGHSWIKYLLLVLCIYGTLINIPTLINNLSNAPVTAMFTIVQEILQIWVLILLFKVPNSINTERFMGEPEK